MCVCVYDYVCVCVSKPDKTDELIVRASIFICVGVQRVSSSNKRESDVESHDCHDSNNGDYHGIEAAV